MLVCLLVLGGCETFNARTPIVRNTCVVDDDCEASVCDESICVATTAAPIRIAYEVIPADTNAVVAGRYRFPPRLVAVSQDEELVVPVGVRAVGQVRLGDARIPADLIFTRRATVPLDAAEQVRARTSDVAMTISVGTVEVEADYQAMLAAGETYDLLIRPTSEPLALGGDESTAARLLPPLRVGGLVVPTDGSVWELTIPYPDVTTPCSDVVTSSCTLAGTVVSTGASGELVPEDGVQVRAIAVDDGRVVSSTGVTDAGDFSITIAPDAGAYVLRASAASERPLFPEVFVDPAFLFPGQAPEILVPSLDGIEYSGRVESADGADAAGASLTFTSESVFDDGTGLMARYTTTVFTGEDGGDPAAFTVDLLPGTYRVVVTPGPLASDDPGDASAVLVAEVTLMPNVTEVRGQLFTLPRAESFSGLVLDMHEAPALGVEVVATALRIPVGVGEGDAYNRSGSAEVGPTGSFDLRLDPGAYDIVLTPADESGYPWIVLPGVTLDPEARAAGEQYELGAPVVVRGTATTTAGEVLAGATVRAYAIVPPPAGAEGAEHRAVLLAETVADDLGSFSLFTPQTL